ncbi:D-serine deaminase-like pyridoxal phosphate-dependent protein [Rhizobium fabae]|uniref:D-serine deaminase-like pyridoxal phosphate-dependent protein n=1 Tax=Rhizobium fabae TaxID=573179 RepID=A0A7W6FH16_9HYPH|nr:D-serine deaminase-like pyridoxal phosphate-dependent protein [Rhizobium fabae]
MSDLHTTTENVLIDERVRGFPPGHPPLSLAAIGKQGWKPYDGRMALPLISLDRQAFADNAELMMIYVKSHGAEIAPHAKTPMSTVLADTLVAAGAWGMTVADIRQAAVLLKAGQRRLILANEIGGAAAARRLAALLGQYPDAELHVFVDSMALLEALSSAWQGRADLPPLGLMVEFGAGRAGIRSADAAAKLLDTILAMETPAFWLTGIAAYEGAAATADPEETMLRIDALMAMTSDFLPKLRARIGNQRPLLVTSGGSGVLRYCGRAAFSRRRGRSRLQARVAQRRDLLPRSWHLRTRPCRPRCARRLAHRRRDDFRGCGFPPRAAGLGRGVVPAGAAARDLRNGHA